MLRFKTLSLVLLPFAFAACGASRSPVPVVGAATDVSALAGEWVGDYSSVESGRSGSITFTLRSATDSAFGDVIMIRCVRVEQGRVSGTLDPYADPRTGERLLTTFRGELKGNTIAGTYTTRLPSGDTQTGRWSVQRR